MYAINPLSVSRYRDRHNVAGAKSDAGDAKLLADLVRTDRHNHRPVAGDSDDADGLKILARVLAELGDDPERYDTAKSRRSYAGTSPLTVASGNKRAVLARHVRNRRLYDAIDQWAFCSLQTSPGCHDFNDQRRKAGDLHHQALRALANRLVGYLHGALRTRTHYNEHTAWNHRQTATNNIAA